MDDMIIIDDNLEAITHIKTILYGLFEIKYPIIFFTFKILMLFTLLEILFLN